MSGDGDGWLLALIRNRIQQVWPEAKRRAVELRAKYPAGSADDLSNVVIEDRAFWAGVVGVGLGALETIPGVGQYIAVGSVLPEVVYLTKLQLDTALMVAALYESDIPEEMLEPILLSCLAYALGLDVVKEILKTAGMAITRAVIEKASRTAAFETAKMVARAAGLRLSRQGLLRAVPVVSIPINATLNYEGLQLFGRVAKHYFSPYWLMCAACGHIQPRKNTYCASCGVVLSPA